jgi:hypothetical protein
VEQTLALHTPDLVINTAAYNRVEDCEAMPDHALRVNAAGPHRLAQACQLSGAAILHFSTDYVFSGDSDQPWGEDDCPRPVSLYGVSKLAGELAVRAACPRSYIVRVSGLFGLRGSRAKGGNFVETMLRLAAQGKSLRVVDDQTLTPSYTADVARAAAPGGNPYVSLSGALGTSSDEERFASRFPDRGQPAEAPWRLALVTILTRFPGKKLTQSRTYITSRPINSPVSEWEGHTEHGGWCAPPQRPP